MKQLFEKLIPLDKEKELPDNYWFEIGRKLYQESGEIPDPLQIRAEAIVKALNLPSGPYSAIETDPQTKERVNIEKDRIIAEYLTNKPGVLIDEGIISLDFRDIYEDGLPQELKSALDPNTRTIMEIEYEHAKSTRERFGETKNDLKADAPTHYFRLPGGIDLFLRGYIHDRKWQENHGEYFKKINKFAKVVAIEGFLDKPFGESLELGWSSQEGQLGDYDVLMKDAVRSGFNGLFTEIDARDISKIEMDFQKLFFLIIFSNSPPAFFKEYFEFFKKEHPFLADIIGSSKKLKKVLIAQSTTREGILKIVYKGGKAYNSYPYLTKEGKTSFEPTFLELGQKLFTDALAAIKLHLIAKLMADGHLEKGPIIDYEGAAHLSNKSFFLKYPQYAMEVVLRTVNELMAGKVKEKGNFPEIYEVFRNPNWPEIIQEIAKLTFKKPEADVSKPVKIGPNQRKLLDYPVDFLKTYNLDPQTIMPSDEEIKRVREKLGKQISLQQ